MHPQHHQAMIFTGLPPIVQKSTCVCFECGSYLHLMFPSSHVGRATFHPLCCVHDFSDFCHILIGHPFSRVKCASISCCSCWVAFLNMKAPLLFDHLHFFPLKLSVLPISFLKEGDQTVFGTQYSIWGWVMVFCSSTVVFSGLFSIYFLMFSNIWLAFLTAIKHQVDIFIGLSIITPDLSPN